MASYLRPLRGPKSAASIELDSTSPLKAGEVFFEYPETGPGTGAGKIKMGDGSTPYSNLPYFLDVSTSLVDFTDTTEPDDNHGEDKVQSLLEDISPNKNTSELFEAIKHFLVDFKAFLADRFDTKTNAAKDESEYNTEDYAKAVNLGSERYLVFNMGTDEDPNWVRTRFSDIFYENSNMFFPSSKAIFDYYGYPTKVRYRKIDGVRGITFVKGVPQVHLEGMMDLNPDYNDVISVRFFFENHLDNRAISSSATAYPFIISGVINNSYEIAVTCEAIESNYTITSNCAWIYVYYRRLPY